MILFRAFEIVVAVYHGRVLKVCIDFGGDGPEARVSITICFVLSVNGKYVWGRITRVCDRYATYSAYLHMLAIY